MARLRRSVLKSERELEMLRGALEHAEGEDFPADEYERVQGRFESVHDWLNAEEMRLRAKLLRAGGLEPGRIGRSP